MNKQDTLAHYQGVLVEANRDRVKPDYATERRVAFIGEYSRTLDATCPRKRL